MAISRDGKNVAFTTKAEAIRLWSFRLDAVTGRITGAREPVGEGIDTATPAGRLQLHILGAIVEFERARIQERVRAGLARVRAQGRRVGSPACKRTS
jgi:hypothetical protein